VVTLGQETLADGDELLVYREDEGPPAVATQKKTGD